MVGVGRLSRLVSPGLSWSLLVLTDIIPAQLTEGPASLARPASPAEERRERERERGFPWFLSGPSRPPSLPPTGLPLSPRASWPRWTFNNNINNDNDNVSPLVTVCSPSGAT